MNVFAEGGDRHAFTLVTDNGPIALIEGYYPSKTRLIVQPLGRGPGVKIRVADASLLGPIVPSGRGREALIAAITLSSAENMRRAPAGRTLLRVNLADGAVRRRYALPEQAVVHDAVDAPGGSRVAWSDAEGFASALAVDQDELVEPTRLPAFELPAAARFSPESGRLAAILPKAGLSRLALLGFDPERPFAAAYPLKFAGALIEPLPNDRWLVSSEPEGGRHVLELFASAADRRVVAVSSRPYASAAARDDDAFAVTGGELQRFTLSGAGPRWSIPWTLKATRLIGFTRDGRLAVAVEEGRGGLWLIPADRATLEAARPALDAALNGATFTDRFGRAIIFGFLFLLIFLVGGLKM